MNLSNIKTASVKVQRVIEASASEVFDAWLDPACQGSPWNGVAKAILQPVVDGLFYRMHLSGQGGYELAHYGRFIVLERPRRMQYTWVSQHTRGLESVVTIDFESRAGATHVALVHENLPDDEKGRLHEQGWQYHLAQVAHGFAARSARNTS
jgi:uncharacterized protein YndB with AHSA1/START domain